MKYRFDWDDVTIAGVMLIIAALLSFLVMTLFFIWSEDISLIWVKISATSFVSGAILFSVGRVFE